MDKVKYIFRDEVDDFTRRQVASKYECRPGERPIHHIGLDVRAGVLTTLCEERFFTIDASDEKYFKSIHYL